MGDVVILAQAAISNTRHEGTQTVDIRFSQSLSLRNSGSKSQEGGFHLEMAPLGLHLDAWLLFCCVHPCCLCVWGAAREGRTRGSFEDQRQFHPEILTLILCSLNVELVRGYGMILSVTGPIRQPAMLPDHIRVF